MKKGSFARNVLSNTAGTVVNVVVAFFLSPFVVHSLGDAVFGLWTLVVSLTGYYGLLDLGIRSGVGQYVTRYAAQEDYDGVNRTFNTALLVMGALAALAALATLAVAWSLPRWIDADTGVDIVPAQWALVITGLGIAASFPLALFSTITFARSRFDIEHGIGISERLVVAALSVVVLKAGLGLVGLALVTSGTSVAAYVARIFVGFRLMPQLRFAPRLSRQAFREIWGYGFYSFVVTTAERMLFYADSIIITIFLSTVAVTYYAIGANLVPYFMALIYAVSWVFTPYATTCDARGDHEALRRLTLNGTRGIAYLGTLVGTGLILLGHEFLALWMGPKYVSGEEWISSATILGVLTASGIVRAAQGINLQILFGMRRNRFLAALACGELVVNIGLSLVLVRTMGLLGVAVATLVALVVGEGFFHPRYVLRTLGIGTKAYLRSLLRGVLPTLAAMGAAFLAADSWFEATSWTLFLAKAALVGVPGLLAGFFGTLEPGERRLVLERVPGLRGRLAAAAGEDR